MRLLSAWSGRVTRELENVIERGVPLTRGSVLQLSLPEMSIETEPLAGSATEEGEDEYPLIVRAEKEQRRSADRRARPSVWGLKRTTLLRA